MNFLNSKFKIHHSKNGFTLIETIIAIAIFAIVMLAITSFFTMIYREQAADIVKLEGTNIAGRALEKIGSEVRKINRAENGAFGIELADEQDFIFYSDVDNDGQTEKIEYFLNGINLERRLTEPGALLDYSGAAAVTSAASYVRNGASPIFAYYNETYTGSEAPLAYPANVTQIKVVGISIDINVNENYFSGLAHTETKIHPRNLKSFD